MQKHAFSEIQQYETRYDPTLTAEGEALYFDKNKVCLPLLSDFSYLHFHSKYELGIILSGEGQIICDGSFYTATAGDIIFVPPNVKHYSRTTSKENPCYAKFAYLSAELIENMLGREEVANCKIPALIRNSEHPDAAALLRGAFEACESDISLKEKSVAFRIAAFLAESPKWFEETVYMRKAGESRKSREMRAVSEYMMLHYSEKTTSAELAALCHLSESQFRRNFLNVFGCSPTVYKNRVRMAVGRELLLHSEMSIYEISEQLGFSVASDFCRSFKKEFGVSPNKMRSGES